MINQKMYWTQQGNVGKIMRSDLDGSNQEVLVQLVNPPVDIVLDTIKNSNQGLGFVEIQAKTGFDEKKIRNIIFRLNKTGKIKRKQRGIYIAA